MKNRVYKIVVLGMVLFNILLLLLSSTLFKNKVFNRDINSINYKSYIETGIDTNEYVFSNNNSFPTSGYVLNLEKSTCNNGGTLLQNSDLSINFMGGSDFCILYFDATNGSRSMPKSKKAPVENTDGKQTKLSWNSENTIGSSISISLNNDNRELGINELNNILGFILQSGDNIPCKINNIDTIISNNNDVIYLRENTLSEYVNNSLDLNYNVEFIPSNLIDIWNKIDLSTIGEQKTYSYGITIGDITIDNISLSSSGVTFIIGKETLSGTIENGDTILEGDLSENAFVTSLETSNMIVKDVIEKE